MALKTKLKGLKNKVVPFEFVPFSPKQLLVLTWWRHDAFKDYDVLVCDGSVRAGKTVTMSLSFVMWAMETFNGMNFAFCGKTVGATNRNIIKPLKQMLLSRGYEVEHDRTENVLAIYKQYQDRHSRVRESINYFYVFGGKDESSQDLIQGITLAGLFCDEVALMPQSFVNQATARCSVTGAKMWFSCNPNGPFHWFKTEWIDKSKELNAMHIHFTMEDNPSLDTKTIERYKRLYTGVFYKRFILGLWVMADGVIFPEFDVDKHVIDRPKTHDRYFVSGDFGIQNPTCFHLFGYTNASKRYHVLDEYYHNGREQGQKKVGDYADDLVAMIQRNMVMPEYIILDPSAQALIVELREHAFIRRNKIKVLPARNAVIKGIQFVSMLLANDYLSVCTHAKDTVKEFTSYVWDSEKTEKSGEDTVLKQNDHAMDSLRYGCYTDAIMKRTFAKEMQVLNTGSIGKRNF